MSIAVWLFRRHFFLHNRIDRALFATALQQDVDFEKPGMKLRDLFSRMRRQRSTAPGLQFGSIDLQRYRRTALKVALWALGLLVLFALVGFFVVPPVAKHYLVKNLSELLNRPVAIQAIELNPFSMTVTVRGFSVKEPGGNPEVFVSFEELFVNLRAESIIRRGPIFEEIRLQRPYVHVARRNDGSYNFSDLLKKFAAAPKSEPPPKEKPEPLRFSLNNIQIFAGKVLFDDQPNAAQHTVTDLDLAIPFLSSLPYLADRYVQPSFSAKVNGTPVSINGRTKPFEDSLETQVDLNIYALDIPRYVEYVPIELGFKIASGTLDTRITATFTRYQNKVPTLVLAGKVGLEKLSMTQPDGRALASLAKLEVPVESATVFARDVKLGSILVLGPEVFLRRERDGSLNWMGILPKQSEPPPDAASAKPAEDGAPQPLKLQVAEVKVEQGQVHFSDDAVAKPFKTDIEDLQVVLKKFALPQTEPASVELAFNTKFGESVKHASTLFVSPLNLDGNLEVTGVKPRNYAPYYGHLVLFDVEEGTLDLSARFRASQAGEKLSAAVSGLDTSLTKLRLRKRGAQEDFLSLPTLAVKGVDLDLDKRSVQVAEVSSKEARLHLVREKDGSIDLTRLTPRDEKSPAPAPPPATPRPAGEAWQWQVKKIAIDHYGITFDDRVPAQPVTHVAEPIRLAVENLSSRRDSTAKVVLDLAINKTGKVLASGPVGFNPLSADVTLDVLGVDLVPLQPYFGDKLNILVTSGDVQVRGVIGLKAQDAGALVFVFKGDAGVNNFASVDKAKSEDFLKWKTLYFGGIDTTTQPFALQIQEVALSEFYSRIIIYPSGQLNVQGIVGNDASAPEGEAAAQEQAPAGQKAGAGDNKKSQTPAAKDKAAQAPAATTAPGQAKAPPPPIAIGKVTLQGGNVNFSDLFIKPNYSANLTEIGGSVTGLSSQLNTTADIDLRGHFAKTAPVQIKGKVNPLVQNLFLDIKAEVHDIELGPFTPYSDKYVGYAIEKGKMSFDVEYKIENRKLTAKNRLTLDQLTFGNKTDSPTATKLPVLLAVALLTDRNGVIDVSLPISGSLDDPKFSIGGIVLQIIFNLIEKAVTAPFALIGSMFGDGGAELAYVEFEPGRAVLASGAEEKLTQLRNALVERPKLKLDVTGRADPDKDREGMRRYRFDQLVKAQKLKDLVKQGVSVTSLDDIKIEPQEYESYLKRAYKEAKFPKPRNLIGIAKDLPKEEMEKLMLANIQVSDDELVRLANQRAQAAKDFVTGGAQVPVDRVFLLAPKLEPIKAEAKVAASRVDFSLK